MFIKKEQSLLKHLETIINTNMVNVNIADMLMTAFSYTDIFNVDEIKQYIQEGLSEEEAITELLYDFYQLDKNNEDNQEIINSYIKNSLKKLNPSDYLNNPYALAVKKTGRNGKYALRYIDYEPYQLFAYDEIKMDEDKEISAIGYFDKKFSYLALTENNNIWMSLNPNEIETMKPYIEKGKGHVLVLGLGMGYVPFMLANKDDVKSVVIVEKDQNIIDIFSSLIWPNFNHKEKIKIIKDDAIKYVEKTQNTQQFDYIFADLWHNPEDGLPLFVALKRVNKNIDCWLETSMYALLRRCMITLLEESLQGLDDSSYRFFKNYTDKVINKFYHKTKNLRLNNEEDLRKLLNNEYLLSLLID